MLLSILWYATCKWLSFFSFSRFEVSISKPNANYLKYAHCINSKNLLTLLSTIEWYCLIWEDEIIRNKSKANAFYSSFWQFVIQSNHKSYKHNFIIGFWKDWKNLTFLNFIREDHIAELATRIEQEAGKWRYGMKWKILLYSRLGHYQ